ncbi:hypothetical protein [Parapedobacter soli]|uniref:hypothetical protein n=1 Tax=Parapedobacter soli TaxID=416955 RepID=UPI0021C5987A|nr:hypothetical protein [Parapedobacter soli]
MSNDHLKLSEAEYKDFLEFVSSNRELIIKHYPEKGRSDVSNEFIANLFLVQQKDQLPAQHAYMFRLEHIQSRFPEFVRTYIKDIIDRKVK